MTAYRRQRFNARTAPAVAFTREQIAWLRQEFQSVERAIPYASCIDVRDFGDGPNGVRDNTQMLLDAKRAAATDPRGAVVYLPRGHYRCDPSVLTWPDLDDANPLPAVRFVGDGKRKTILQANSGAGVLLDVLASTVDATGSFRVGVLHGPLVQGMTLLGGSGQTAIRLRRFIRGAIEDVEFAAASGTQGFDTCILNYRQFQTTPSRQDDYNNGLAIRDCLFDRFTNYAYDDSDTSSPASPHSVAFANCMISGRDPTDAVSTAGIRTSAKHGLISACEIYQCDYGVIFQDTTGSSSDTVPEGWVLEASRFEGCKTANVRIVDGASYTLVGVTHDCHNALDASWHPTPILIDNSATASVKSVVAIANVFYPVYGAADFTWTAVSAGSNLAGDGFVTLISSKFGTLPPSGTYASGSASARVVRRSGYRTNVDSVNGIGEEMLVDGESFGRVRVLGNRVAFGVGTGAPVTYFTSIGGGTAIGSVGNGFRVWNSDASSFGTVYGGTGTPEGALAAAVGSLYLRDDGGAGTTLYMKESGTGNTGWIAMGSVSASAATMRRASDFLLMGA